MQTYVKLNFMPTAKQKVDLLKTNRNMFADVIWSRGRIYLEEGKVELTFSDGKEIHANVYGTTKYSVRLDFNGPVLKKAVCSCPYSAGICKHSAAVLMAFASSDLPLAAYEERQTVGPVSKKQYSVKLRALAERDYHISRDGYYESAYALFESSKSDFTFLELPERFSQIFTTLSYLFPNERNEEAATKFLELSHRVNWNKQEAETALRKALSMKMGDGFLLMALADPMYHSAAVKVLTECDRFSYYYRYTSLVNQNLEAILDLMKPEEIRLFAEPHLNFPRLDDVIEYLFQKGETKIVADIVSMDNYYMDEQQRIGLARRIAEFDPVSAKSFLRKGLHDYSSSFVSIATYWDMLTPEEKEEERNSLFLVAQSKGCARPFGILSGAFFDASSVKQLSLEEVLMLKERIKSLGPNIHSNVMKVIEKTIKKARAFDQRSYEIALGLISYFDIPPHLGLLNVEVLRLSYTGEEWRRLYLKAAVSMNQLDALRLWRYPDAVR